MGKKLKKAIYFYLKYHYPPVGEEFLNYLKFDPGQSPQTTLENIYLEWKSIKGQQIGIKTTQLSDTSPINVTISNPLKSVTSRLNGDIKNKPIQLKNGLIPRPVLHESLLKNVPDPMEVERCQKYESCIDTVVNRICAGIPLKESPSDIGIEKCPVKITQAVEAETKGLASIKEKMQRNLERSFVSTKAPAKKVKVEHRPAPDDGAKGDTTMDLHIAQTIDNVSKDPADTKEPPLNEVQSKKVKKGKVVKDLAAPGNQNVGSSAVQTVHPVPSTLTDSTKLKLKVKKQVLEGVVSAIKANQSSSVSLGNEVGTENEKKQKKKKKVKDTDVGSQSPLPKKLKVQTNDPRPDPPTTAPDGPAKMVNGTNPFPLKLNGMTNGYASDKGDHHEEKRLSKSFRRVDIYGDISIDPKLNNNSFEAMKGSSNSWGQRANDVLKHTKGKSFKHEKTKKKRGTYSGGLISLGVNSVRFSDAEDE